MTTRTTGEETVSAPHPAPTGTGRTPRPRRSVPAWARPLLRIAFRYSYTRDAWVLKAVGNRWGPVIAEL